MVFLHITSNYKDTIGSFKKVSIDTVDAPFDPQGVHNTLSSRDVLELGKSKELENERLIYPYRFPKVKTNPTPTPEAEGWICFDLREEVWTF